MPGPAIKVTLLFQLRTVASSPNYPGGRIAGWSESWYYPGSNLASALNALQNPTPTAAAPAPALLPARAACLPIGAAIVGARLQVVDPPGLSQSIALNFPGGATQQTADTPQTALLLSVPGVGVRNIRRIALRGIPDVNVVEGEYQPAGNFNANLIQFTYALFPWQFRGRDLTQTPQPVLTITAAGVVTAINNLPYAVGNMLRVLKSKDATGNLRGGRFQVSAIGPSNNQLTLLNWPYGACTGGSLRLDTAFIYANVDFNNIKIGRVVIKKVGRPFTQYRGRRSRKR